MITVVARNDWQEFLVRYSHSVVCAFCWVSWSHTSNRSEPFLSLTAAARRPRHSLEISAVFCRRYRQNRGDVTVRSGEKGR